jgi:hypothetical protein
MPKLFADVRSDFARCRVLRHSWQVTGETEANGSKLVVLMCESCTTLRYDRWNTRTGDRWGNPSYIYPIGYQDRDPGHDNDWWRKTYAEFLFSSGILEAAPSADTRPKARKRA